MPERRFTEEEVSTIFERAAANEERARTVSAPDGGMTLSTLQEIGREVGLAPQAIADAVATLDAPNGTQTRRSFGVPLRVGQVIELDAPMSEAEWERTVVMLREIFDARGTVRAEGSLRQWTNGNLQVYLEPSAQGQRLRMRTFKGGAPGMMGVGVGVAGAAIAGFTSAVLSGGPGAGPVTGLAIVGAAGAGILASTVLNVRRWAHRRQEQMNEVARRVGALQATRVIGATGGERLTVPLLPE